MAKKDRGRFRDKLWFRLFFIPFLAFGLGLLALAGIMVAHHLASQSWQPVSATLLERGIEQSTSDDSGATRLKAKFAYRWQGRDYQSTRTSFSHMMASDMSIKPDDWDERLDSLLAKPGATITAWVDPAHPADAVVLRDIRWLEAGIEIIIGLLLVWASALFLFGYDPHRTKQEFSWRVVIAMWIVGVPLAVLVPLLWRDAHQVWAALAALPLLLAIFGTTNGLRLAMARSSTQR
jgi:hypothetical protein